MATQIDMETFVARLRAKRGDRGLREIAEEIGELSASTLSRIENGKVPDLDIFLRLCDWIGTSPDDFLISSSDKQNISPNTLEIIEAHLRADKNLDEKTAKAIAEMVKSAYQLNRRDTHADKGI